MRMFLRKPHTRSHTYTHTHTRRKTGRMHTRINIFSCFGLTQNTRLKANIRYLMHVSPPDSAAMVVLEL